MCVCERDRETDTHTHTHTHREREKERDTNHWARESRGCEKERVRRRKILIDRLIPI